jgi:quercetin dioxygenase-like cupin family protein
VTDFDRNATRVEPGDRPVRPSPSGLLTRYLACDETGSRDLFVGQQWLGQGQRVYLHTHAVEEVLVYVSGRGTATLGDEEVPVGPGTTLVIPPGVVHGFRNDEPAPLHVLVIFPGDTFARTDFVEPTPDQSALQPATVPPWP